MAYGAAPDVTLFQLPKALAVRCRLVHLPQRDIHKCITVNQVSVERLSVFQFDHLPKMCHKRCWTTYVRQRLLPWACLVLPSTTPTEATRLQSVRRVPLLVDASQRTMVAKLKLRLASQTNGLAFPTSHSISHPGSGLNYVHGL